MERSKIRLSAEELELVQNSDWILTKNHVIDKVYDLFGSLSQEMQEEMKTCKLISNEAEHSTPKISKGEKYEGLPYVMLDYPRQFSRTTILAIRSFFWWGKMMSITLHLNGEARINAQSSIESAYTLLVEEDLSIAIGDDEWRHDFDAENFISLQEITKEKYQEIIRSHPFLKLGFSFSLAKWDEADQVLFEKFRVLLKLVRKG